MISDELTRRRVETVACMSVVSSTDSRLSSDPISAMYATKDLEDLGIIGPSNGRGRHEVNAAAARLWLRADDLEEELAEERGRHRVTEADLRNNIRRLERLQAELTEAEAAAATLREAREDLEKRLHGADTAALAGWAVAALLLVALAAVLWAVIA